jgi:hypothetical protein
MTHEAPKGVQFMSAPMNPSRSVERERRSIANREKEKKGKPMISPTIERRRKREDDVYGILLLNEMKEAI